MSTRDTNSRTGQGYGPIDLKTDRPHAARVYDVLLGGKTNYPADRKQAEKIIANVPTARPIALANRIFMHRATRYLAAEAGVRQFLDIGTGIPTSPNLHEVAQGVAPESRVVYVDNDPIVLAHSRALHTSDPAGATAYIDADVTDPDTVLASPLLRETIDLDRPVGLSMCALLHWLPGDPYTVVKHLVDALAPGSHVVLTHMAPLDDVSEGFRGTGSEVHGRTREEFAEFFAGLDLLEPGIVVPQRWRPALVEVGREDDTLDEALTPFWAGVGVKRAAAEG
ncbi:SAM-dependent methyltransferase [Streptomyces montanisoli]|uniref:SAM-dependent methyltransferase n=1 Tax=Streptomyces montanisoli TaxID=2798581 RepID=A0A940MC70_9ACTN|nr:SAM-dependent methyltransferase [Streptomyces montanisoli]MBP0456331.1 SAM-dependent methyltransferase [Streptomyces montanisoli]